MLVVFVLFKSTNLYPLSWSTIILLLLLLVVVVAGQEDDMQACPYYDDSDGIVAA